MSALRLTADRAIDMALTIRQVAIFIAETMALLTLIAVLGGFCFFVL